MSRHLIATITNRFLQCAMHWDECFESPRGGYNRGCLTCSVERDLPNTSHILSSHPQIDGRSTVLKIRFHYHLGMAGLTDGTGGDCHCRDSLLRSDRKRRAHLTPHHGGPPGASREAEGAREQGGNHSLRCGLYRKELVRARRPTIDFSWLQGVGIVWSTCPWGDESRGQWF